ncbi:MAG: metallophosphoesterase [bacterium]|nr:metallophosphoesterase [bacterium]
MFFTIVFLVLFGLQFLVFRTFRNFIKTNFSGSKILKFISIYPFIIFNLPLVYVLLFRRSAGDIPPLLYDLIFLPFYIFQGATIFIGLYLLIGKIIKTPFLLGYWILNKFKAVKQSFKNFFSKPKVKKFDNSRRIFLRTSAGLVSSYAFIGSTFGVLGSNDFDVSKIDIKIDNLPEELKGTTISLFCDVHSGPYMKEDLMKEYVNAINELKSDIICIPGDLTNSVQAEAIPFAKAFRDLKASKGIFASLGNHDYFSNAEYISQVISNETPIQLLRNNSEIIQINGKNLCIMGSEDTRQSNAAPDSVLMGYLDKTVEVARQKLIEKNLNYDEVTKIALFHKPYFLEMMKDKDLQLVLSGHTHGGQVVLANFGNVNISFAGAVSKYISGLYQAGGTKMYISRGIGSVGLPIRMNCPPEITKITLI